MPAIRSPRPKALVADGQDLTLRGVVQLLSKSFDISEARTRDDVDEMLKKPFPDLFIADYSSMRDFSAEDMINVRKQFEQLTVLAITSNRDKKAILKLVESGIHGFLFKDCTEQEFIHCVEALIRGERFFCNEVFGILMEARLVRPVSEHWPSRLTNREVDIIRLIVKGHSTSIIAGELNLSPHTVSTHRKNIIRKLKIKSPAELVAQAYDLGLIARDGSPAS
jgi:DNA-binding NarL/FixJ family response regulator